ncbi:MAG: amino acid permease [Candidatus Omnitrophica bacterium]|nr:amino acid permease [Candidatus Omnitrophota bacterium]
MNHPNDNSTPLIKRSLGLFDVVCIIVGIIIGSAIYQTPSDIAGLLGSGKWIMLVWMMGGILSFLGALCYAELASAYPREGGDYFFLHHTYGSWAGFLYAWGRIWVIHSGNIAMMASIAGIYGEQLYAFPYAKTVYALAAVVGFTAINCLGLKQGKWTQNGLSAAQVLGLSGIILVAFFVSPQTPQSVQPAEPASFTFGAFFLSLIFVQLAFGGWSDCAFVAADIKNPGKNVLRALLIGLSVVTLIYCLVNAALLYSLGPKGMAESSGIMAKVMEMGLGPMGGRLMAAVVIICALGSVNGMVLVGGRIYHAFGRDHALFRFMGQWDSRSAVPTTALVVQGVISCILLLTSTFAQLVIYTSAAHWLFMAMVGVTLIILRRREPDVERPFRVPFYPFIPLMYLATCGMLLYSSFNYGNSITPYGSWIGFGIVIIGLPVYWISRRLTRNPI